MNAEPADPRIARHRRRRRGLYFLVVVFVAAAAWIFRPHFHADPALIDPRLRALEKPYRHVDSTVYFDEGSAGIMITDANGQKLDFIITYTSGWKRAYVQSKPSTLANRSPVTHHAATIQELAAILSGHCEDWWDYRNMECLTGRLGDKVKQISVRQWDDLKNWWSKVKP